MLICDSTAGIHERVIDRSLLYELMHPDKVTGAEHLDCSIAHAIVPAGESTLPHTLKKSTGLYFILVGGAGPCTSTGKWHRFIPGRLS